MILGTGRTWQQHVAGDREELPSSYAGRGEDCAQGLAVLCSDAQASLLKWLPTLMVLAAPLSC